LYFYISAEGGNSLIIKQKYSPSTSLESFVEKIIKNQLQKMETDGVEPEILIVGGKLSVCEYIAIYGGYEREKNCEQTFTSCTNYLLLNEFELTGINFPAYCKLCTKICSYQE
jgi:hypothetical protein